MLTRFKSAMATVMGGMPGGGGREGVGGERAGGVPGVLADLPPRFEYSRPAFLQLTDDEVQVSADSTARPILVPRDISRLPWAAGYAEVINGGKSKLNEDQAAADTFFIRKFTTEVISSKPSSRQASPSPPGSPVRVPPSPTLQTPPTPTATEEVILEDGGDGEVESAAEAIDGLDADNAAAISGNLEIEILEHDPLPATYFAVFDGHAGTGAALVAVHMLHDLIQEQLLLVHDLILQKKCAMETAQVAASDIKGESPVRRPFDKTEKIQLDQLIYGALETAFTKMDNVIAAERRQYRIVGGCTCLVSLFFLGKLYVANAGDSRAVICRGEEVIPMSTDFNPESERQRIQFLAELHPELLHNHFTTYEFPRKMGVNDVGKKHLYRDSSMKGWSIKTINEEDTKMPIIYGEGKKTRLLATIGVTRGFGDHDLRVYESPVFIKPFLSSVPEVQHYDVAGQSHGPDDVLILGSDGLWDVTSNQRAMDVVRGSLAQFSPDDKSRYTSAAQELVMCARGVMKKGWRTPDDRPASGDDITAFVIPLNAGKSAMTESSSTESSLEASTS